MSPVLAFGDDGSAGADGCWEWIANHRWAGWSLETVTALPPADMRPVDPDEAELHAWSPDEPRPVDRLGFGSVEHLRAEADPRVALISKNWDLVAIGPRGSGMLKTLHLGSTADWLLREPTSPLVVARQPGPVGKVLVAADGSAHSGRAIDTLASLPWLGGVAVRVVTIDDGRVDPKAAVRRAVETVSSTGADVDEVIRKGRATDELVSEIEDHEPDLVVMGARGHGGISRLVVGSTTSSIAGSFDRSILVAHGG